MEYNYIITMKRFYLPVICLFLASMLLSCEVGDKHQSIPILGLNDNFYVGKVRSIKTYNSKYLEKKIFVGDKIGWNKSNYSVLQILNKKGIIVEERNKELIHDDSGRLIYSIDIGYNSRRDTTQYKYRNGQLVEEIQFNGGKPSTTKYHYFPSKKIYVEEFLFEPNDEEPLVTIYEYVDEIDKFPINFKIFNEFKTPFNYTRIILNSKGLMVEKSVYKSSVYKGEIDELSFSISYKYEFDEKGNWISRVEYKHKNPIHSVSRKIEYYSDYNPIFDENSLEDLWLEKKSEIWLHLQKKGKFDFGENTTINSTGFWELDVENNYITLRFKNKAEKYKLDWDGIDLEFLDKKGKTVFLFKRE